MLNIPIPLDDQKWMKEALKEAKLAFSKKEVPIGAVVVYEDQIIGRGHNQVESLNDATAHAEILAITAASNALSPWRLSGCTLYVTVEPCVMKRVQPESRQELRALEA